MMGKARSSIPQTNPRRQTARLDISIRGCEPSVIELLERVAHHALTREGYPRGQLHIEIVGDAEMRRHHQRWMNDPTTTDVLTFDLRDSPTARSVDGQLIVCRSVARRAARQRLTDWRTELALYVVHGCLHLCGYTDTDEASAAAMHRREDELLGEFGIGPVFAAISPKPRARKKRGATTRPRLHSGRAGVGPRRRRRPRPRATRQGSHP